MGTVLAAAWPRSLSLVSTTDISAFLKVDSQLLGAIALCLAVVALGSFVMIHKSRVAVNRRFGIMALTTAGWILTISLALAARDPHHTVMLGRVGFAFASGIPFALVWMVDAVSELRSRGRMIRVFAPGVLCLAFILMSFSDMIVADARPGIHRANFVYGSLHHLFGVYFLTCFGSGLYTLAKTIKTTSGITRLQLRYLLLGISLTGLGAMSTNLVIPVIWKTSRYSALGPYFSLLFFSCSAHAIIRYRLMDIKVVIRQGGVYVVAIVTSASLFLLTAELLRKVAGYDEDRVPLFEALAVSIGLAICFQPLKSAIQKALNRYLYRQTYDYQRTVRETGRQLSTMLELDQLLVYLTNTIETTFKAEPVAVYLRRPSETILRCATIKGEQVEMTTTTASLAGSSALVALLQRDPRSLVREEAARDIANERRVSAASVLQELGGAMALPLRERDSIAGIVIVGPKRSGDPYFADDIDFLETLVSQAAVAMKNAQLYREVVLVNEYVDNILSTMESGVIAVNSLGEVSLFNSAAERLTGLQGSTVQGSSYRVLPGPLVSFLRDVLEAQASRAEFEVVIEDAEGVSVPLVCSTAILKGRDGSLEGALIVFSDLSRLKGLELENMRVERLASFGRLASGVAHEIKNPLVAIRTFAELLPERFTDVDFREDFGKVVIGEIARIDDLVGRLRGIAATPPAEVGAVDVREPITDTVRLLRAQLEQSHTSLRCDFDDAAPFVADEEAQLKQLFLNLFLNSIEAMGIGGDLRVRVRRRHLHGNSWVVISVSDTGPGIPEDVRSSVFDPFFTTKSGGSGLGLAICRGITDAHRGAIRAEKRSDGTGATFVIEFPAAVGLPVMTG